jgi:hypothetical protein
MRYNREQAMDAQTIITRTSALLESGMEDELFALDVDGGNCYGFNATATEIWRLLETPMTLDALCNALRQTHDIDHATCLTDTSALVEKLAEDNLVVLTLQ